MPRIVAITVSGRVSVKDFMNMSAEPFALNVETHGLVVRFEGVTVTRSDPCVVTGFLASIESEAEAVLQPSTAQAIRHHLLHGELPVIHSLFPLGDGYPIRWRGGQLPGSRTFAMRDFVRRVIAAIDAATASPVAA